MHSTMFSGFPERFRQCAKRLTDRGESLEVGLAGGTVSLTDWHPVCRRGRYMRLPGSLAGFF